MSKNDYKKTFAKGEVIFKQGDKGRCAYLIDHGRVEILVQGQGGENCSKLTRFGILGIGDIFGEMAILSGAPRSATAVALDDVELIEISKSQLKERIEDSDDIVRYLIQILLGRMKESLKVADENPEFDDKTTSTLINIKEFKRNQEVVEKIKMELNLNQALYNDEFNMHYQPILDSKTGKVAGFEALMRWNSPERGMVRPDIFMGVAEETSLIIPIGRWIIQRVCYDFARLKRKMKQAGKKTDNLFIGINIAVKQFNDPKLFEVINECVEKYKLKPSEIKLEITERVLIAGDFVFDWIRNARKMGFSVALDDFGTGYSSLSYLANLEVNNIKVDKSFVSKIQTDKKTESIVKSIIQLSHALGLTVIAEGVEEKEEWNLLKQMGCNYMQGYLYSRPVKLSELISLMTEEKVKKAA